MTGVGEKGEKNLFGVGKQRQTALWKKFTDWQLLW